MNIEHLYSLFLQSPTICTDTRKITEGCLFFALKGDNFNGNSFAEAALKAGAAFAIIDEKEFKLGEKYILVEDVLTTLQELANFHRKQFSIPFIGITGTNGKTTTKELINSVLSQRFRTYATQGNLNNHIGVPLTLLSVTSDTEIGIIEMGANHQKEIAFLCGLAEPTHGLITNVGKAHLEGFGGFEGVKKGKGELYDWLNKAEGTVFINRDNNLLLEMCLEKSLKNIVFYGNSEDCLVQGTLVENDPFLTIDWTLKGETHRVKSNITGIYNLENILAAISIGAYFGLSAEQINMGISSYVPKNNRSQITKTEVNTLICDYYNANPSSMSVALDNFAALEATNKVIILGDMFELGDESVSEHRLVLKKAETLPATQRIFIGKQFKKLNSSSENHSFETTDEAAEYIKSHPIQDATVLIKGSRGMKLEKLVELL
jgi:UDP-N-acetylmuramoyl-tripeptide--D-alanyl-D-alanine ligase